MTVDLDKLEALALVVPGMNWYTPDALPMSNCDTIDAAFIAAASPDVVLALVAEVRQLRARVDGFTEARNTSRTDVPCETCGAGVNVFCECAEPTTGVTP